MSYGYRRMSDEEKLEAMVGKTVASVEGAYDGSDEMIVNFTDGTKVKFYHEQDCCETVRIEDFCGWVSDLEGTEILSAEESTSEGKSWEDGTSTWTFYLFRTRKGDVTVRWLGESNGFYSESVSIEWS
jgi:hypothetical protein